MHTGSDGPVYGPVIVTRLVAIEVINDMVTETSNHVAERK